MFVLFKTYVFQFHFTNYLELDVYDNYAHEKFREIWGNHGTVFEAFEDYLTFSVISSIIGFIVLYYLFGFLYKYSLSIYLREFSLWGFLLVGLIQPNIEYASFMFGNQMKMLFFKNLQMKILMMITILGFFVVFAFAICAYILYYYHYKKLAKYFVDDCYRIFISFLYYGVEIGFKAILLGFTHSFLFN